METTAEPERFECLSDQDLLLFLEGRARSELIAAVEVHVDSCERCRRIVAVCAMRSQDRKGVGPAKSDSPIFPIGFILAGRYEVLDFVGRGGMGEVYRVSDRLLDQVVALKTVYVEEDDPGAFDRIKAEVQLARLVTHPHVCRIFDLGVHGEGVARTTFLTMEFISGETLARRLRKGGLSFDFVQRIARQIAEALACAHDAGIVHRDVKPENVILRDPGENRLPHAVVMDFGLARRLSSAAPGTTAPSRRQPCGTPGYMAPEIWQGRPATRAVDIYAFGLVLRDMLSGHKALVSYAGGGPESVVEGTPGAHVRVPPPEWKRLIEACVRPDPKDRPRDFHAVVRNVDRLSRAPTGTRLLRRSNLFVAAAAAVLLLVVVASGWGLALRHHGQLTTRDNPEWIRVPVATSQPEWGAARTPALDLTPIRQELETRLPETVAREGRSGNHDRRVVPSANRRGVGDARTRSSPPAARLVAGGRDPMVDHPGATLSSRTPTPASTTQVGQPDPNDAIDPFATDP